MNSWLIRFRISAAIDAQKPLSPSLRKAIAASKALTEFEQRTRAVERALTETKPQPVSQLFLHRSIMRSLEAGGRPSPAQPRFRALRWLATPALALLLAFGLWSAVRPPAPALNSPPLAALSNTLEMGDNMTRTMPAALVAPLSDELARVNRDLDTTAQFLLASVP